MYSQQADTHRAHPWHHGCVGISSCTNHTHTQSTHTHTGSTNLLPCSPSRTGWSFMRIHMYMCKVDPFSSHIQTFSLPVAALWIPVSPVGGKQPLVWRTTWRASPVDSQGWAPHLSHRNDGFPGGVLRGPETRHSFLGSAWFGFLPGIKALCSSALWGDVPLMGW